MLRLVLVLDFIPPTLISVLFVNRKVLKDERVSPLSWGDGLFLIELIFNFSKTIKVIDPTIGHNLKNIV